MLHVDLLLHCFVIVSILIDISWNTLRMGLLSFVWRLSITLKGQILPIGFVRRLGCIHSIVTQEATTYHIRMVTVNL